MSERFNSISVNNMWIYSITRDIALCVDTEHFHPIESITDKASSLSIYTSSTLFHISQPMRLELTRLNQRNKIFIGTYFFDASINRITSWIIGVRNVKKM